MKKLFLVTVISIVVGIGIWSLKPTPIKNSPATAEGITEESISQGSPTQANDVKIPTHGSENLPVQKTSQPKTVTSNEEEDEYTEEEKKIFARSAQETMHILQEEQTLSPETEFAKARDFEMDTPDQGMFTGRFIDAREGIKLALYSGFINDSDKGFLADNSCLQTPDTKIHQVPNLKVRYAGNGIALAMAGSYFLRMGMEIKGYRVLIAKLYVKENNKWKYLSDISAQETTTRTILEPCKFE